MYLFCFCFRFLYEVVCMLFYEFLEIVELIDGVGKFLYLLEIFFKFLLLWLCIEGRIILVVFVCKGIGVVVVIVVRIFLGINGGYSRWFLVVIFLLVVGVDDENKLLFFFFCSIYNDFKVNCI